MTKHPRLPHDLLAPDRARRIALGLEAVLLLLAVACRDPVDPNAGVRTRWLVDQVPIPSWIRPAVVGRLVLFGTKDGTVVARDTGNGALVWTARVAYPTDPVRGENMVIASGLAIVPVSNHVTAINAVTGAERWRYVTPVDSQGLGGRWPGYLARTHMATDGQTVFIPAWGASVSAVDLQTGAVRWVWRGDNGVKGPQGSMGVAVSGDTVIATAWHFTDFNGAGNSSEAWVLGLDRATGRELWRVVLTGGATWGGVLSETPPVIYQNLAIVGIATGDLYAIDRATQAVKWTVPSAGHNVMAGPALSGDTVYFDRGIGNLSCVSRCRWHVAVGGSVRRAVQERHARDRPPHLRSVIRASLHLRPLHGETDRLPHTTQDAQ